MSHRRTRYARPARAPRASRVVEPSRANADQRAEKYEVWRTPGTVVEQGLWAARRLGGIAKAPRIADLGAGSGPFGQRARRVWPGTERLAVEVREEERRHLRRHYEHVHMVDMFEDVSTLAKFAPTLIVSNPPYSLALAALRLALSVVAVGGHVLFFLRTTFGGSAPAWEQLRQHPPSHEFSVAGRPHMRTGSGASGNPLGGDFVGHTWLLFQRRPRPRPCLRYWLPPLDPDDLAWVVHPGTEARTPEFPSIYMPHEGRT